MQKTDSPVLRHKAETEFSVHLLFSSIQVFMGEAHPHREGHSALLSIPTQMLILSKNALPDILRNNVQQNTWAPQVAQSSSHKKLIITDSPCSSYLKAFVQDCSLSLLHLIVTLSFMTQVTPPGRLP